MGLLAIGLFWNGIVSVFLSLAIGGLYTNLVGPLPKWFPAPDHHSNDGNLGTDMSLGMTNFHCIFLIPFVTVGAGMILAFLMSLLRPIVIITNGADGRVRTGFGPFNWTKRFDALNVKRVSMDQTKYSQNGEQKQLIKIETADGKVKFGSMIPDRRREWLAGVLYLQLVARTKVPRPAAGPLSLSHR